MRENWTDIERQTAKVVRRCLLKFLEQAQEFANGKYGSELNLIPTHLKETMCVVAILCKDGLVVRYEKQIPGFVGVGKIDKTISEIAHIVSDGVICIKANEVGESINAGGVNLSLIAANPNFEDQRKLFSAKVNIQVTLRGPEKRPKKHERPYHASVRNEFNISIECESLPDAGQFCNHPRFLVTDQTRFPFAWECIEIYPNVRMEEWNEEFAPAWAEAEISKVVLAKRRAQDALAKIDPNVETRNRKRALLHEYKQLLDARPGKEEVLQSYLRQHLELLCPNANRNWPKLRIGAHITDFVFQNADGEYFLVELEQSEARLFTKSGNPASSLAQARKQVTDWWRYLEDNLHTVQRELGLSGISVNPYVLIIIGRSAQLTEEDRRRLATMNNQSPKIRILTYDDIYENAKAAFTNLLGPIDEQPFGAQVFYYKPDELHAG